MDKVIKENRKVETSTISYKKWLSSGVNIPPPQYLWFIAATFDSYPILRAIQLSTTSKIALNKHSWDTIYSWFSITTHSPTYW